MGELNCRGQSGEFIIQFWVGERNERGERLGVFVALTGTKSHTEEYTYGNHLKIL